jgi:hypothetical protein
MLFGGYCDGQHRSRTRTNARNSTRDLPGEQNVELASDVRRKGRKRSLMKFTRTLGLMAVFAIPQHAPAAAPVPPGSLGQVEATVKSCARVDSKSADRYEELRKKVVAGMSEKDLAAARSSNEYNETFESVAKEFERLPTDKALAGCHAALQGE